MKKYIRKTLLTMIALLPLAVMAQGGYTLTGNISGLKVPAKAYLYTVQNGSYQKKDSAVVKDGKFSFRGSVNEPEPALLNLSRGGEPETKSQRDYQGFFLENSAITFRGTDSLKTATITGSVAEKEKRELDAAVQPLSNTIVRLNREFRGKPKDEAYKKASDSVTHLVAEIAAVQRNFAESHLNSYMGLYIYNLNVLNNHFEPAKVEPLFHRFSPALQASALGKRTLAKIETAKKRQTGIAATDFTQADLNDKPFTLSSLRGKYVLVDFWASWCAPCRAENPNLIKAYAKLKDRNFEVVGVSLDQGKAAWENAVKQDKLPWIHVCDLKGWKNEVAVLYGINAVPQNLLIDPNGMIIAKNLRGEDLTEKLSAFIK